MANNVDAVLSNFMQAIEAEEIDTSRKQKTA